MPSTTRDGFNTVTQVGSWGEWSNLSLIERPATGHTTALAEISVGSRTNVVRLSNHEGLSAIPVGSTFDSMSLGKSVRKTQFAEDTEVDFFGGMDDITSGVNTRATAWSNLDVTASFVESFAAGDMAFWDLEYLTPTQVIDRLKNGALRHRIWAVENIGTDDFVVAQLEGVTLVVTYTEPAVGGSPGRRGAVLVGF